MLEWFDSTAVLDLAFLLASVMELVDMSGLDSDDVFVVWVQVPPLVVFFLSFN